VDFTIFWRRLSHWAKRFDSNDATVRDLFINRDAINAWLAAFHAQTVGEDAGHDAGLMLQTNPKFVLRNHLGELAIRAATRKDFSKVAELLKVLEHPNDEYPEAEHLADFPPDWAGSIEISCSS
jgi:uncharacterized protein YdiU (UPF0061 family)